jgi:hypothetical protein
MTPELKQFIQENRELLNQNTKEAWEEIYGKIPYKIAGEFTQTILDAGINDPASIMRYIPKNYLRKSNITNYEIPSNVTSIGDEAFFWCVSLTNITIPDGVTSIGEWAFSNCRSLKSVTIPNSVTSISKRAFSRGSSLTEIVIPDSVTSIGDHTFA